VKILCLIDSLSPGGAESSLAALAPEYGRRGIQLDVGYLKERQGLHERFHEAGARLFSLAAHGRVGWARAARRLIIERRPDLVHTTLFEADVAGRIGATTARVPVVSSLVNEEYGPEQFADPQLSTFKLRGAQLVDVLTARSVVRWHAITEHVARVMRVRLRLRGDRIDVVPRGRDPILLGTRTEERREQVRRSLGVSPETKLLVAAARQEHQKGLDVLLEAMTRVVREVSETRLLVAGREGNQTPTLHETMGRLDLRRTVDLLGPRADVADLLCAADVFVFPSRFEGLGSVLIEAMALEAPIVATALPAVVEILDAGEHALLVPTEQPALLAAALVDALSNVDAARTRAIAAHRRFLERYTIGAIADGMAAFYDRAIADGQRRTFHQSPGKRKAHFG
jgi:glycosyltransferase involved in cell wall biosynthesis